MLGIVSSYFAVNKVRVRYLVVGWSVLRQLGLN